VLCAAISALLLASVPVTRSEAADERQSVEELRNTVINLLQALVDQGVITREKAAQMVKAAQDKAAADAAALAKSEEGAVRVPYVPQIVQDQIAKQVEAEVKPDVVADVVKEAKAEKWGVPGALADWLTRTRLTGTVTVREEDILFPSGNVQDTYLNYYAINQAGSIAKAVAAGTAYENTSVDRARFRGRARIAVDSDITDSLTAGVRIATGNTSDLVAETQTLDGTAPYQFGVDELFIRLDERNSQRFPWFTAVGGRFENPYTSPTNLIFHRDLTFDGIALTGRFGIGDGSIEQSNLFVTAGAHPLQEVALSPQDKWLVGSQIGAHLRWGEGQSLRISGAFYDYFNVTGRQNSPESPLFNYTAPQFLRQGNTYFNISGDPTTTLYALAAKYRLADVNMTYQLPVGRYTFAIVADAVKNLGYDAARVEANTGAYVAPRVKGYQAEVSFGDPTTFVRGAWRGTIGYRYLQRDAVIDAYTDSDFHFGGTDATGYYLVGDLGLANRLWLRFRYMSSNAIDGLQLAIDTVQLDLNTRF
jgi:hypothetical protein